MRSTPFLLYIYLKLVNNNNNFTIYIAQNTYVYDQMRFTLKC